MTAASVTLAAAAWNGVPVSTTHTITGAIIGGWAIDAVRSAWGDEPAPTPAVAPVASTVATVPAAAPGP